MVCAALLQDGGEIPHEFAAIVAPYTPNMEVLPESDDQSCRRCDGILAREDLATGSLSAEVIEEGDDEMWRFSGV
jgi:hypothetical protein